MVVHRCRHNSAHESRSTGGLGPAALADPPCDGRLMPTRNVTGMNNLFKGAQTRKFTCTVVYLATPSPKTATIGPAARPLTLRSLRHVCHLRLRSPRGSGHPHRGVRPAADRPGQVGRPGHLCVHPRPLVATRRAKRRFCASAHATTPPRATGCPMDPSPLIHLHV